MSSPKPPYYAVIFRSRLKEDEAGAYGEMATQMVDLARQQEGFLGVESVRTAEGVGITVSYWSSEAAIAAWRDHADHVLARQKGRTKWYSEYFVEIAKVERAYGGSMD